MDFRAWNRKKNLMLRELKAQAARFILDKPNPHKFTPQELPSIRKVLFLRHDNKLGDMIVSSVSFRELKKWLPQAEISVISGPSAAKLIETNPHVNHIFLYKKNLRSVWKLGKRLQQEKFDLYIDLDKKPGLESLLLLRLIRPRFAFGFNRENIRMYNITAPLDFARFHVTEWHQKMMETLGILPPGTAFDASYDLFIPPQAQEEASRFLKTLPPGRKTVVFNPFAASKHRCFRFAQAKQAAELLPQANVILVGPPDALNAFGRGEKFPENLFAAPQEICRAHGVWASVALLAQADLLISPDTYIVHAASALKKPLCALYAPADGNTWFPKTPNNTILVQAGEFTSFDISLLLQHISL